MENETPEFSPPTSEGTGGSRLAPVGEAGSRVRETAARSESTVVRATPARADWTAPGDRCDVVDRYLEGEELLRVMSGRSISGYMEFTLTRFKGAILSRPKSDPAPFPPVEEGPVYSSPTSAFAEGPKPPPNDGPQVTFRFRIIRLS